MKKLISIALLTAVASSVNAQVRINGFANLVGGITSSDDTLYDYNDSIGFTPDSLFAVQVSGDVDESISATGQIVAYGEDDYDARFIWAYMTYEATDNLQVSAGRFRVPLFTYSATLDVGYSYHWITPPESVYDVAFNNMDGFRISYNTYAGDWEYEAQLTAGDLDLPSDFGGLTTNFELENLTTVSFKAQRDWLTLRAVYGRAKTTFLFGAFEPLLGALASTGNAALAEDIRVSKDSGTFIGGGIDIDLSSWFLSGEYTYITTDDSVFPETTAFYLTSGIRLGKFTPHITFEDFEDEPEMLSAVNDIPLGTLVPLGPGGTNVELRAATLATLGSFADERTALSIGVRYDWRNNIALKLQYTKQDDDLNDANDANLVRFAINYIF
ncbi:porin [Agarilytica rhodophyticola]|uniref:porin n=1 Tax=Agarilytica rhodophyticola TaxID=1737490 RepID=UPI000B34462B|nr:porin [Agarilytica rhodophyticola]